jgi:sporulation protein YlmC with PRC-barrel domain
MANHEHRNRVGPLSDLSDFTVASDDPDVRGWDVISADGRKIGDVKDLIVDTGAMKVRYLDVEVDKDFRADKDHRILVPIGQAQLHEKEDHVHVNALASTEVRSAPRYSGDWSRSEEETVRRHYGTDTGRTSAAAGSAAYYGHSHYDDDRFFGSRRGTGSERQQQHGHRP